MTYIPQVIFLLIFSASVYYIVKKIGIIRSNILLGKPAERSDRPMERLKVMTKVALGQKKMFKKPIPAILHLFIYIGFIIVNIEILEIVIDGLFGTHRVLAGPLGNIYPWLINVFEFFALSVLLACVVFLARRNIVKVDRFKGEEMTAWPKLDANIILIAEIFLMIAFLSMNAADSILQERGHPHYASTGSFFFSGFLIPLFSSLGDNQLVIIERFCWWFHIIGVLAFANYVFWKSKHLHIFLAFPNTYYSKLTPFGEFPNMNSVTKEVKLMLNIPGEGADTESGSEPGKFGANDVQDLSWKNLMDAYSCTQCGRCTQQCPANITGKKLSPRKIVMDTRTRLEEVGENLRKNGPDFKDGKTLLDDYITYEELLACTTCNACVEACPVNIDPLNIIMQLRQYKIMESSEAPGSWNAVFSNIENNLAPWKFSPADRASWINKLNS
ncbi:MAG TPA: (Fe-S)-binding protein [Cytophagaceae bacterium]|jgi:heterodisulfide reductase subunit C